MMSNLVNKTQNMKKGQQSKNKKKKPASRKGRGVKSQRTTLSIATTKNEIDNKAVYATGGGGTLRVSRREFVKYLTASDTEEVWGVINVNPGNYVSFPWLAGIANNYEKYRFRKLRFMYVSTSNVLETGALAMVPDFNPQDPPPNSVSEALNYNHAVNGVPWSNFQINIPTGILNSYNFLLTRNVGSSISNVQLYDAMNLYLIASNTNATFQIGELWVEYTVELAQPTLNFFQSIPAGYVANNFNHTSTNKFLLVGTNTWTQFPAPVPILYKDNEMFFSGPYQGLLVLFLQSAEFDSGRVPAINAIGVEFATNNSVGWQLALLNDEIGSTDTWFCSTVFKAKQGATMSFDDPWSELLPEDCTTWIYISPMPSSQLYEQVNQPTLPHLPGVKPKIRSLTYTKTKTKSKRIISDK